MDILMDQDEALEQHKRYFQMFLDAEDGYGNYGEKIRVMMNEKRSRLIVDLNDLRMYDTKFPDSSASSGIVERLVAGPMEYIPAFEAAVKDLVLNYDSPASNLKDALMKPSLASNVQQHPTSYTVGFEGNLGTHEVTPRGLLANYLSSMVAVSGIVVKCSAVRPKIVKSVHYCPTTNGMLSREYRDGTSLQGVPTSSVYPTKDEHGNLLETEFGLSVYKDYQRISIQEAPETAPHGQLPRSVEFIVENDLVDKVKPGDRVKVMGSYRSLVGKLNQTSFRSVILANNVQVLGKEIQGIRLTARDLTNIRSLAKTDDIFDIMARSIAPSIYGHGMIKQALLLQLLGGVEKNLKNGTHLRGDVNILMVGDPSTAKSQLLRFVRNIAPLAINTTGRGSSGVGLTAAVVRDPETKERRLEAGAMVLADRGIVCIDEFDKMSEADRVAIHEVMEQQTVTIAKAGIHATLNARCSVLAAANPVYGQYRKDKKPQENINLPDSLLSRFDLLFVVLDKLDRGIDRRISDHVLRIHRYERPGQEGVPLSLDVSSTTDLFLSQLNKAHDDESLQQLGDQEEGSTAVWQKYHPTLHGARRSRQEPMGYEDVLNLEFLKKYIYYAKQRASPTLTDEAIDVIAAGYAELRSEQEPGGRSFPVTARSLETLIRLSTAHAKIRLSRTITCVDADKAMDLMKFALYHDVAKPEDTAHAEEEEEEEDNEEEASEEEELGLETTLASRKRNRGESRLEDALPQALMQILNRETRGEQATVEDAKLTIPDLMAHLASDGRTVSLATIKKTLKQLEEQNVLIYDRNDNSIIGV